jgi:hypothetical protein
VRQLVQAGIGAGLLELEPSSCAIDSGGRRIASAFAQDWRRKIHFLIPIVLACLRDDRLRCVTRENFTTLAPMREVVHVEGNGIFEKSVTDNPNAPDSRRVSCRVRVDFALRRIIQGGRMDYPVSGN